jgi:hypothetical protein
LKLAVYALIGYMIYEFYQGLSGAHSREERGRGEEQHDEAERSVRRGIGTMTGRGKGQRVQTEDASGSGGPHVVGRGVV